MKRAFSMSIKSRFSLVFLTTGLMLLSQQVRAAKPEGTPYTFKTVENRELKLYVTKPKQWQASDQRPAIVFFHGGGWVGGAPGQFTEHSKYFASRGGG